MKCALACAFFLAPLTPLARAANIDLTWTGATGTPDWTNPGNWSGGTAFPINSPGMTYTATLNGGPILTTVGDSGTVGIGVHSLSMGTMGNEVLIHNGSRLATDILTGAGLVSATDSVFQVGNAAAFTGQIQIASGGMLSQLQLADGAVLGGEVVLEPQIFGNPHAPINGISGISGLESATNRGTIIASNGSIGNLAMFTNHGIIVTRPELSGPGSLEIDSYRFDNTGGTIDVTGVTSLQIASPHFLNYDGNTLAGGTYNLSGALILSGGFTTIGTGTQVDVNAGGAITNGTTNLLPQLNVNEGTLGLHGGGNSLSLLSSDLVNTGNLTVDTSAQLSTHFIRNEAGGQISVGVGSTLNGQGIINDGTLQIAGTADLRGGGTDSFRNLTASNETLSGGTYNLSSTGTLLYDAGSGAHGGAILHITEGTSLSLARGGQIQFGVTEFDALALLTSNGGSLSLTGGTHSFLPVGGTFLNDTTGVLAISGNAFARVYGDLTNTGNIDVTAGNLTANNASNTGFISVQNDGTTGAATATFFGTLDNGVGGQLQVGLDSGSFIDTVMATDVRNDGGDIRIAADGLLQATNTFTQTAGTTTLTEGFLQAPAIGLEGGEVLGNGELLGDVDNSGGTISPVGGNVLVSGNYTQGAGGTLNEGLGSSDFLFIDGDADLNGIFRGFDDLGGMPFVAGESFEILHFGGALTGNFSSFDLPTLAGLMFTEDIEAHDIRLVVSGVSGTAAPEPSFMWLGGGMIAFITGWRRLRGGR